MAGEDEDVEDVVGGDIDDVVAAVEQKKDAVPVLDSGSEQKMIAAKSGLLEPAQLSRKEKRKQLKKIRRKQIRQQVAEEEKLKESAGLDDPAEQLRIQLEEQIEAERLAKENAEHAEQERLWLEREKKAMEDFERQQEDLKKLEEARKPDDTEEDSEYVDDDGPPEIIWKGNEIIVRKRRVKGLLDPPTRALQDATQAASNPLPPQSAAFASHNKYVQTPSVIEHTPAFGTEQDKTHCPFHIKTGVCRFGVRCSRVHVYPDQSFTLLMRNMYTGPGLAWENDEGLEHSDEEVAQHYEEFYEDVHSEFLQFGELVNFKVCNNASSHLRGNLYVHYKAETSAQAAYSALNGRFYAGKQITCEFVGVTRWRVALCGEYMKGRHRLCSRGSACNFLHCFRNSRGEYEWADWDSPPPRSWVGKMAKLFGYEIDQEHHHGYESHDDVRRRHWSPGTPQREYRHSDRRSREKHHNSRRDDGEDSARLREHRRQKTGSPHYRSNSEDSRRGEHRSHRRRDGHKLSSSKVLDERGIHGHLPAQSGSPTRDNRELRGDAGEQEQRKRHKLDNGDIYGEDIDEFINENGGVTPRDRSRSSSRLLRETEDDRKYKRHRSRDLRDSDRRQSLDLRSSSKDRSKTSEIRSPADQIESRAKDVPVKGKYYEKGVEARTRNYKSRKSVDSSGSSDKNYIDDGHKRHRGHHRRYSEGRRSTRKTMTEEHEIESEESPSIDDRKLRFVAARYCEQRTYYLQETEELIHFELRLSIRRT
ncbi:unnamed protein product [Calypogeia fissa]